MKRSWVLLAMAVVFGVLGVVVGAVAWQQNVAIGLFVLAVFGGSAVVMAVFALRMRDEEPGVGGTAPDADLATSDRGLRR